MRKQRGKYLLWSAEMLEKRWNELSAKRERLINKVSMYDVQMEEVKEAYRKVNNTK